MKLPHKITGYFFLLITIFTQQAIFAQQSLNLDFEKLSVEGVARPWGWSIYSYAPTVSFTCDSTTAHSKKYSLKIEGEKKSNRFELSFFVEPNQILGRKITIQAWGKSQNFKGKSGLHLSSLGKVGEDFGVIQQNEVTLNGGKDWQKYETSIDLSSDPHSALITLFFDGEGTVWFDDLQLRVDGQIVAEVPVAEAFTEDQIAQLAKETVPIKTVEPNSTANLSASAFTDLASFKKIIGDAKIIALGEATHGTSEFFKVKHRLLQYAILELGVRVFVLEDNQLLVERINDYVLYGKGEAKKVIKGLFAVWNTQEMLSLIQWMRAYNIEHPEDRVEFVGMDVQNPQLAFEKLAAYLAEKDADLQERSAILLQNIKEGWRNSFFTPDSTLKTWDQQAAMNYDLIFSYKKQWLKEAKSKAEMAKVEWCIQYARLIKQFVETALGGVYEGRDKAMAENIEWIIQERRPDTKLLVWAHDSHISRGDANDEGANFFMGQSMGSYLSEEFKEDYKALGLFTYQGSCLGTISYSNFTQKPFELYTSPEGSLDEALHQIANAQKSNFLLLNLKPFRASASSFDWITQKRPVRYVGYVAEDYGFGGRYSIPYQFDGIVYVDQSEASRKVD